MTKQELREECFKALHCLYIAVDEKIAKDVDKKAKAYIEYLENELNPSDASGK